MHRFLRVSLLALVCFGALGAVAYALDQTNGQGKTNLGGTLGFNAQQDLSGSIEFQDSTDTYKVHCNDLTKYKDLFANDGSPKSIVNATNCFGQEGDANEGSQYYLHIEFIDRGEPGTNDVVCLTLKLFPGNANPVLVKDCGKIQNGNVQIHGADLDPDRVASNDSTEILGTV